jgi:proteasome lid subunit RPN8/RPN11
MDKTLYVTHAHRQTLYNWVQQGYPHETCGVLIGHQQQHVTTVTQVSHARNMNQERARDRFILNPDDFIQAEREARNHQQDIVGIWHSHPDHPAKPSETDRVNAWENWSYVIISVSSHSILDMTSWRLQNGAFFAESLIEGTL